MERARFDVGVVERVGRLERAKVVRVLVIASAASRPEPCAWIVADVLVIDAAWPQLPDWTPSLRAMTRSPAE